jgi:hypothetical protein
MARSDEARPVLVTIGMAPAVKLRMLTLRPSDRLRGTRSSHAAWPPLDVDVRRRLRVTLLVGALLVAPACGTSGDGDASGPDGRDRCGEGEYENSEGECIPGPSPAPSPPPGATAQCRDGDYSFSRSRSGTCSHHGGVARWL